MNQFDLWVKGCKQNKTILYCLEGEGDTGLYKLTKEYWHNNNRFYEEPVYIAWIDGKQVCVSRNYIEAYNVFIKYKEGN